MGYRFSPRLADLGDARFWRLGRNADYGILNELARQSADDYLIVENWDDMLHSAGSVRTRKIKASEFIKSLHRSGRASTLGRAIG